MARVRDQHVGVLQGQLGPQIFKLRKGKHFVTRMPRPSTKPAKEILSVNRKRFTISSLFATAVNKIPFFKQVWDMTTPDNISPFNGIFKANYNYVTASDVSDNALVLPHYGDFSVATRDVSIDNAYANVTLEPLGNSKRIDTNIEKYMRMGIVVKCTDPITDNLAKIMFFSDSSANVILNTENPLFFSVNFAEGDQGRYADYDTHVSYIAFVTTDMYGNPVKFSKGITA